MYLLLSRTQAGPGRTVKQEQEEISRNHVHTFSGCSVLSEARDSPKHLERLVCLSMKTLALMMFPKGLKVCKRFVYLQLFVYF